MKILLIGVNAKYIHTCLAVRSLAAYAADSRVAWMECSINDRGETICGEIYRRKPDVAAFSCYIWNISFVLEVAANLKKVLPDVKIVLGGPEVSCDSLDYLQRFPFLDAVIRGEGELPFAALCQADFMFDGISGVSWRKGKELIENPAQTEPVCLSEVPFAYEGERLEFNKLVYYESSRGCPFRCSYCLSSTDRKLRFRELELVKRELRYFMESKVKTVKFVDRTFNADRERTCALWRFLIQQGGETTFHFEIGADLLTEEMLEILKTAPKGLFQFEIGVQSTNPETLGAIDRRVDFALLSQRVKCLLEMGNIHLHLDLIAGLPYEDLSSFAKSFDQVMALRPHVLQLGFLKLLRGTKMRAEEARFGYRYTGGPPYEVLGNQFLSYEDILILKGIEDVFEKYYNSGAFHNSISYLLDRDSSCFDVFSALSRFFEKKGYTRMEHSRSRLYEILCEFGVQAGQEAAFRDYVKLDYLLYGKNGASPFWGLRSFTKEEAGKRFAFLEANRERYFSAYGSAPCKELVKRLRFEPFVYDVLGTGEKKEQVLIFDKDGIVCTITMEEWKRL